ncbi:uncharacterized protein [Fopius arisanus]|uniref:F-box domain-containing protein n=2 Tax=Fopius arisanus TaxID=64838 RepID=A0A9R1U3N5_9HYME|nr:PREDICTED: uncharacterized protein LOC105269002 [Fopius arisanus]
MMAATGGPSTTIQDLPDECLRKILLQIPITHRINFRNVCQKWREVIDDSWSAVKKIECHGRWSKPYEIQDLDGVLNISTIKEKILEGVTSRCGDCLITLTETHHDDDLTILSFAAKYCTNIREATLLISSEADDEHVNELLAANQRLRVLKLHIKFKRTRICLRSIGTKSLEALSIQSCGRRTLSSHVLTNLKQIVRISDSLKLFASYFIDEALLELLGKKIMLEWLMVTYYGNTLKADTLHSILNLKYLRELAISLQQRNRYNKRKIWLLTLSETADFILALVENLKGLVTLCLDAFYNVTDDGFMALSSLPKLRNLSVAEAEGVTDKFLYLFSHLDVLCVAGCSLFDDGVVELLQRSTTMRVLNISGTPITDKTLVAAVRETKKRRNGIRLTLRALRTKLSPLRVIQDSPFLHLEW